jgi:hypothetical protein
MARPRAPSARRRLTGKRAHRGRLAWPTDRQPRSIIQPRVAPAAQPWVTGQPTSLRIAFLRLSSLAQFPLRFCREMGRPVEAFKWLEPCVFRFVPNAVARHAYIRVPHAALAGHGFTATNTDMRPHGMHHTLHHVDCKLTLFYVILPGGLLSGLRVEATLGAASASLHELDSAAGEPTTER